MERPTSKTPARMIKRSGRTMTISTRLWPLSLRTISLVFSLARLVFWGYPANNRILSIFLLSRPSRTLWAPSVHILIPMACEQMAIPCRHAFLFHSVLEFRHQVCCSFVPIVGRAHSLQLSFSPAGEDYYSVRT